MKLVGWATQCIVCLGNATSHVGYLTKGDDGFIMAAWCIKHRNEYYEDSGHDFLYKIVLIEKAILKPEGYCGKWNSRHGCREVSKKV